MTRIPADQDPDARPRAPRFAIVALLAVAALLFRVAAWLSPSSYIVVPPALALPINALGLLFLAAGLWVWLANPSRLTRVFLVYGLGGCIHWGGTIGSQNPGVAIGSLTIYMAATAMGDAAFLHLSLRYPPGVSGSRLLTRAIYAPAVFALLAAPAAPFLPRQVVEVGLGVVLGVAFLMSIAGGLVFIVKWFLAKPAQRRDYFLTPIVVALVISNGLTLLADARLLPGQPDAWNLLYGLEPLVLAWALARMGRAAAGG